MAHANSATVGVGAVGRAGTTRENVPRPVHESRPTKISAPTPAATRPGTSTSPIVGPATPAASISRKAAISGDPMRVLMAAKLPAAPTTATACAGTSRGSSRVTTTPSPPPRAMSGASGPITAPSASPARAAKKMPGSSDGGGEPWPASRPSAGDSPPVPGR